MALETNMIDKDEIHVCYNGTIIFHVGTKDECEEYHKNHKHASYLKVSNLEGYGSACFDYGFSDGLYSC